MAISGAAFGNGSGPIWLRGVNCDGTETTLADCPTSIFDYCSSHFEDAGVRCLSKFLIIVHVN